MGLYARWKASWDPARRAIQADDLEWTYGALDRRVRRAASLLGVHDVAAGDVVAVQLPRSLAALELTLGCLALGAIVLPMNPRYTPDEVHFLLEDSGAKWHVSPDDLGAIRRGLDGQDPAVLQEVPWDAPAMLMYTSGTTGRPKGALHTQGSLHAAIEALQEAWAWSADDVLLHTLPAYHVHGLVVAALGALRAGARIVWAPAFDAGDVGARLSRGDITVFMGVPTFHARLLREGRPIDLSSLRLVTSGSAPLPPGIWHAFEARFGVRIVERYGMTEIGIVVSNPIDAPRPGWIGRPLPGVRARIHPPGDIGELLIRSPSMMRGYRGLPAQTAQTIGGGWMRTGDLGRIDDEGWIQLVGRASDLVITGGMNVYPAEVEAVLAEHRDVQEIAVFGVPHDDLGEIPVAAVVGSVSEGELRAFGRERLAPYKVPRRVHVVDHLPRNAMGKVVKARLRADHGGATGYASDPSGGRG